MSKTLYKETFYITGITGFLGNNIVKLLKNKNVFIYGLTLPNDKNHNIFNNVPNVKIIDGDITNIDDVQTFLSLKSYGDKYVIHCAGKVTTLKSGDHSVEKINFGGTKLMVDEANKHGFKKFIYISSVDSLNIRKDKSLITEQDRFEIDKVSGIYAKSKVLANNYVIDHAKNYIILLPTGIMGPNDTSLAPLNSVVLNSIKGKMPAYVKGGYNVVDVRNVAEATISSIYSKYVNTSYIITGEYISIKDIIYKSADIVKQKKPKLSVAHIVIKGISPLIIMGSKIKHKVPLFTGFSVECLEHSSNFSYKKASNELAYKPYDIDKTIKDTVQFFLNDYL